MAIFAAMVLHPGGIIMWLLVGLIAGWLASNVMGGGGYGVIYDVILGLVGAVVGGLLFGYVMESDTSAWGNPGFWGTVLVAFLGACALLVVARFLGFSRRA
jgi:uncharacterized membrane protein YeaQ/YmgE (transglycosylase-associated protein family)